MRVRHDDFDKIRRLAGDAKTVAQLISDSDNVKNPPNAAFFLKIILDNFEDPEYVGRLHALLKTLNSIKSESAQNKSGSVTVGGSISPGSVIVTGNGNTF
jgi:hypothetical protein